jgi:hypothetical protein
MASELIRYEAMVGAIQACHSVDEIVQIRSKVAQIEAAARIANDVSAVRMVTEIRVRSERRLGQLLDEQPRALPSGANQHEDRFRGDTAPPTLEQMGISKKLSARSRKLASISDERFEAAVEIAKEVAGQVTAAAVIEQRERIERAAPKMATSDTRALVEPIVMSDERAISELFQAVELLNKFQIDAADVYDKFIEYQRYRITDNLDGAIEFLTALRQNWRDL